MGPFTYREATLPTKEGLPSSNISTGSIPSPSLSSLRKSLRTFEDDIRRMRMAAWHGADHIMVIRTAGQSIWTVSLKELPEWAAYPLPVTGSRPEKSPDLIEEEVGRPINYHSYVSGVAGPEVAVMFAEEGVNGAHQIPIQCALPEHQHGPFLCGCL